MYWQTICNAGLKLGKWLVGLSVAMQNTFFLINERYAEHVIMQMEELLAPNRK